MDWKSAVCLREVVGEARPLALVARSVLRSGTLRFRCNEEWWIGISMSTEGRIGRTDEAKFESWIFHNYEYGE